MSRLDNDAKSHCFQFKLPVIQPPFSYPSIFIRLSFGTATVKRLEASGPKYCFTLLKDLKEERAIPQKKNAHKDAGSSDVDSRCNWACRDAPNMLALKYSNYRHGVSTSHDSWNSFLGERLLQVLQIRKHKNQNLVAARCYVFALALPTQ